MTTEAILLMTFAFSYITFSVVYFFAKMLRKERERRLTAESAEMAGCSMANSHLCLYLDDVHLAVQQRSFLCPTTSLLHLSH